VWWYTSIIPVFWRRNLKASLSYIVRPVSIKKKKKKYASIPLRFQNLRFQNCITYVICTMEKCSQKLPWQG
jgi:hypothetical protein